MKYFTYIFVVVSILLFVFTPALRADADKSWTQYSEGISVAIVLKDRVKNEKHRASIHIFIKNTSDKPLLFDDSGRDWGIQLFFQNTTGSLTPLRDYTDNSDIVQGLKMPTKFRPSEVLERTILLSSSELAIVLKSSISCKIYFSNPRAKNAITIEMSPIKLALISD